MPALTFRVLRSDTTGSTVPVEAVAEGEALLTVMQALEAHASSGLIHSEQPSKNRHGARRWCLFAKDGAPEVRIYLEPIGDVSALVPGWLEANGYPLEDQLGWYENTPDGEFTLLPRV